jgi:hypothetical protein
MYDLEGAVRAAITDCKSLKKVHPDIEDQTVLDNTVEYAEKALKAKDIAKMLVAFEMVDQIKNAKRPSDLLKLKRKISGKRPSKALTH